MVAGRYIKNGNIDWESVDHIPQWRYEESPEIMLEVGDVIFTKDGSTLGNPALIRNLPGESTINSTMMLVRSNSNIDSKFLYQILLGPQFEKLIHLKVSGSGIPHLFQADMKEFSFLAPSVEEQKKISNFFEIMDKKIQFQQQKIDLLQEQKKGFLQKMFPKAGERQPEMRFDGFKGDWEQHKLGEVSNIFGGGTPSTNVAEYWNGDIDWYSPAEIGKKIYVNGSQKKITEIGLQKSSARILPVGTILFTSRAGIGNTAILSKEGCTNQGFQSIVPLKDKLDSYFIFSRTHELKRYGEINGAGSTFVEVSGKQMAKMPIFIPCLEEQQKIGTFFKKLDDTIALHQKKLDLYQKQKQGFMQQMFI
ncbi:restriction endonuclease subunit S [Bacillus pseudomycoides]|nr:restriction endonuclease subunit S [Bacillus pseudomycoides]